MFTPATTLSKFNSNSPENRHTSVDVPPISKPTTGRSRSALYEVKAQPTKPPAGPDSTALRPVNLDVSSSRTSVHRESCAYLSDATRPPSDFMNSLRSPAFPPSKWLLNPSTYSRNIGLRYASITAELPRGRALIAGERAEERDIWVKPILRAISATCCSCSEVRDYRGREGPQLTRIRVRVQKAHCQGTKTAVVQSA